MTTCIHRRLLILPNPIKAGRSEGVTLRLSKPLRAQSADIIAEFSARTTYTYNSLDMPNIFPRGLTGGSLDQNPPNADRHITSGGSDWAWTVFAIMLVSDLAVLFWTFAVSRGGARGNTMILTLCAEATRDAPLPSNCCHCLDHRNYRMVLHGF